MDILEQVKNETREHLIKVGYSVEVANETVNQFASVSDFFRGKPSRVKTFDGSELYLF